MSTLYPRRGTTPNLHLDRKHFLLIFSQVQTDTNAKDAANFLPTSIIAINTSSIPVVWIQGIEAIHANYVNDHLRNGTDFGYIFSTYMKNTDLTCAVSVANHFHR